MKINTPNVFDRIPNAIIFDFDNTLYSYDLAHESGINAIRQKAKELLGIDGQAFDASYAEARKQIKEQLSKVASSHSRLLYAQRFLELHGLGSQIFIALEFEAVYWRHYMNSMHLFSDVREVLDEIRLLGIPLALVTDLTAQIQFRKLIYLNIDTSFDYIVSSEESGSDKQSSKSFLMAIDKLKPKGDCYWVVGDDPNADVIGGRQSINAITIQKIHEGVKIGCDNAKPDAYFSEYYQLKKILLNLQNIL